MKLSNQHRRDIAIGLTQKAIAKHGETLTIMVQEANKKFWELYRQEIDAIITLTDEQWANLYKNGMVSMTERRVPCGKNGNAFVEKMGIRTSRDVHPEPIAIILASKDFTSVKKFFDKHQYRQSWVLRFVSDRNFPRIEPKSISDEHPMFDELTRIKKAFDELVSSAKSMYDNIYNLMMSFDTDKQCLNMLPEAKDFLPLPMPRESKSVAPAEYANKLRAAIAAGVPDTLGA